MTYLVVVIDSHSKFLILFIILHSQSYNTKIDGVLNCSPSDVHQKIYGPKGIERYASLKTSVRVLLIAFKMIPTERIRAESVAKINATIS